MQVYTHTDTCLGNPNGTQVVVLALATPDSLSTHILWQPQRHTQCLTVLRCASLCFDVLTVRHCALLCFIVPYCALMSLSWEEKWTWNHPLSITLCVPIPSHHYYGYDSSFIEDLTAPNLNYNRWHTFESDSEKLD